MLRDSAPYVTVCMLRNVVVATAPEISIIARNDHKLEGDDLTVRGPKSCPLPSFLTGHSATQSGTIPACSRERRTSAQHLMFAPATGTLCMHVFVAIYIRQLAISKAGWN